MKEATKNMLIGLFVLGACFLIISTILFLKPTVGDGKKTLYVRFSNINKINVGTRVLFAGKPIGEVVAIEEIYNAREQPADHLGQVYFYQLTLKVDSSLKIYNTDEIALQTSGLLGEKAISIFPKAPPLGIIPRLISEEPIYASSIDPIESAFDEIFELSSKVEAAMDHFTKWMQDNSDDISFAVKKFGETMEKIDHAVAKINDQNILGSLHQSIQNFDKATVEISSVINEMNKEKVFDNLAIAVNNAKTASESVSKVATSIADAQGTLGRMINSDDLYLHLRDVLSKADTLCNDVNHYGVLFHLNKNWQRTRLQKMVTLNSLENPKQFRNFFEKEVDEINTAMSRLSLLIEKSESSLENNKVLKTPEFKKDFSTLLRQVDELSENIKLYNEKLQEGN